MSDKSEVQSTSTMITLGMVLLLLLQVPIMVNFAGSKGRSEKSPCESGEMKAEPLRYYDKYITV
jgi:hypothetical protein